MTVGKSLSLKVRNARDAIGEASEAAEAWLERYEPSAEALYFVLLAIEELVLNCIEFGYDDEDEHTILVDLWVADGKVTMRLTDDGHAFDPLAVPAPDLSLGLEQRPVGGLGIYLLRELADDIAYERRDERNRLTLSKRMR